MTTHTPGPWRWEVNETSKVVSLCGGKTPYDLTILQPRRWGMNSAGFMLRDPSLDGYQLLHPMQKWLAPVPGREHHKAWFQTIDHPDAHLIAAAPDLHDAAYRAEWWLSTIPRSEAIRSVLRAAIAKAEGR